MALCLHVATVVSDERCADAGEYQRVPALPDGPPSQGIGLPLRKYVAIHPNLAFAVLDCASTEIALSLAIESAQILDEVNGNLQC
jgi:hypothetical protein